MQRFTEQRKIEQVKITPHHPAANNVETLMKPLAKAMKIGLGTTKKFENEILKSFLVNYRDTPHPSTGLSPGSMLLRDGYKTTFPRKIYTDTDIKVARSADKNVKNKRAKAYNASRHTKKSLFKIGDYVLVKNFNKRSKFEPQYMLQKYIVHDVYANGTKIVVKNLSNDSTLIRHPNDLKFVFKDPDDVVKIQQPKQASSLIWKNAFDYIDNNGDQLLEESDSELPTELDLSQPTVSVRRSTRERRPPEYYSSCEIYAH